jgi:hypothetical protein
MGGGARTGLKTLPWGRDFLVRGLRLELDIEVEDAERHAISERTTAWTPVHRPARIGR